MATDVCNWCGTSRYTANQSPRNGCRACQKDDDEHAREPIIPKERPWWMADAPYHTTWEDHVKHLNGYTFTGKKIE